MSFILEDEEEISINLEDEEVNFSVEDDPDEPNITLAEQGLQGPRIFSVGDGTGNSP